MTARVLFALAALICLPLAAQTATSSIQGQVLDAKSGAPVRFANVMLMGPVAEKVLTPPRQARPPAAEITADEQGRFTFKDLAAGNYGVAARREGYEPTRYGSIGTGLLTVPEGKAVTDINLKMPPCGVIAGKVINEKGEPLRNVEMVALRYYYGAWLWRLASGPDIPLKVYTNDLGEFRISNLVAGQYIVRAAAPPQQPKTRNAPAPTYPSVFFPAALSPEAAQPLMVDNGLVTPANIVLNPGPAYRISGVIDSAGSQQEVCFGLAPKHYNSAVTQVIGRVARKSSADGSFIIDDVPPGSYALSAVVCRASEPLAAIQMLDIAGNIEGLRIQLSPGASLSGMVKAEGFTPAGVRVILRSPELLTAPVPNAIVKEDGGFVVEHLVPRHYMVEFAGLPTGAYVKSVRYGGHEVTVAGFEWTADASLEIILSNQGAAQLTGAVVDKMGAPVRYPMVTVLPADGGPAESAKDVMGDENGKFVFTALRPGAYKALAWQTRFNPLGLEIADPMLPQLFEPNARTLTLAPGVPQTAQLTLNTVDDVNRARAAARMTPPKNP